MSLTRLPRVGEVVRFGDGSRAKVTEVKTNGIVWCRYEPGTSKLVLLEAQNGFTCFIGRFADGTFNQWATLEEESKP